MADPTDGIVGRMQGARGARGAQGAQSGERPRRVEPAEGGTPPKAPRAKGGPAEPTVRASGPSLALTRRQREIYDYISDFVEARGYSPSLEEIAAAFGLSSVATVHKHVRHLVDKGYLRKAWNRSRSVEPVPPAAEEEGLPSVVLPILGSVAAGSPIEAIEPDAATADTFAVPADMVPRSQDHYILRVRGDSMIDDQICDGDMVVIERRSEARNGETVVALVDGDEATLKRFYRDGADVKLVPANQSMSPMQFHASRVEIRGVVRGLVRRF
jgi:repressor LexA